MLQDSMLKIHEGKRYKLAFSNKSEVFWPISLLDGITGEKISGSMSMLVFVRNPSSQWDWYPNLMLKSVEGAKLLIRITNMQSIHWRKHYESGFVVNIEEGKPYIHFDGCEPLLVEYRPKDQLL